MIELLVLGCLAVAAVAVIGSLGLVFGLLGFLITLPFRILGAVFHVLGALLSLPFLLIAGVIGVGAVAIGLIGGLVGLLVPLLPFLLIGAAVYWLFFRRREPRRASAGW